MTTAGTSDPFAAAARPIATAAPAPGPSADPFAAGARPVPAAPPAASDPFAAVARPSSGAQAPASAPGAAQQAPGQPNALQSAHEGVSGAFGELQTRAGLSVRHPIDAVMHVLGAPQAAVAGLAQGIQEGQGLAALGRALHDATNLGSDDADADVDRMVGAVRAYMPKTDNPVGMFLETFAAQTITDPLTWIPVLNIMSRVSGASRISRGVAAGAKAVGVRLPGAERAARAAQGVQRAYETHVGEQARKLFTSRPELDPFLDPHAKAARMSIEEKHLGRMQEELGHSDDALLKKHDTALRNVSATDIHGYELPEEVRQRYLQEPWRYGNDEMRRQALELGYRPDLQGADARWAHAPEGLLDYNLRKDYQFLGKIDADMSKSPAFAAAGGRYGSGATKAGFEHSRMGDWDGLEADQRARVAARLKMGRDSVRKRRVDMETVHYLGKYGGAKEALRNASFGAEAKKAGELDVGRLSHSPTAVWAGSPLRIFSTLGKQAVMASPLPHLLNNVGTLAMWGGRGVFGSETLGRAMGYFVKGISPEQLARLKNMGAMAEYTTDAGGVWAKLPGGKQWIGAGQHVLNRGEVAVRQAMVDALDKELGGEASHLPTEYAKAQRVRDAIGDYRNVSAFVSLMNALGAPFAPFMGVFSSAARRTLMSPRAYRFEAPLRAQQDLDAEPGAQGLQVPNPAEAYARMLTGKGWLSPARTGPIPQALNWIHGAATGHPDFENADQSAGSALESLGGPFLSQIPELFGEPYGGPEGDRGKITPGTMAETLLHFFLGEYLRPPLSPKPDERIMREGARAGEAEIGEP